jgi:dCMP deaminase
MRSRIDEAFMAVAWVMASRGTCVRRQVGCVLVDVDGHILSTGYNGAPKGALHCIESPCRGANEPSGTGLDKCEALHAEQNALIRCMRPNRVYSAYCTTLPCVHCFKMLANTNCQEIVYWDDYPAHREQVVYQNGKLAQPIRLVNYATEFLHPTKNLASAVAQYVAGPQV